jgi:hypothetical protein
MIHSRLAVLLLVSLFWRSGSQPPVCAPPRLGSLYDDILVLSLGGGGPVLFRDAAAPLSAAPDELQPVCLFGPLRQPAAQQASPAGWACSAPPGAPGFASARLSFNGGEDVSRGAVELLYRESARLLAAQLSGSLAALSGGAQMATRAPLSWA